MHKQDSIVGGGQPSGPLTGLRVMDVSIMAAGPYAGSLLGMLGAEVIKVESPDGDGTRVVTPTQNGMGTNFISMNVNKKDVTLDVKTEEGLRAAHELAASCDVFVQNFRVGVVERLKLDYETLRRLNPRLIYCAISGFGETGPLAKAGCADYIMQAFAGFARMNGTPDEELEAFRFTGFLDLATASVAVQAVMAALLERDRTGQGQKVEVSMLEAALEMEATRVADYLGAGVVARPRGSESPALVPDRAYAALDQEIFLTAHDDAQWRALCAGLGLNDAASDTRFATNALRVAHRAEVDALLEAALRTRPALWWLRVLERAGVPCAIAHGFETFRHHAQVVMNGMVADILTPEWGEITVGGLPWHFSATPCEVSTAPRPGEHTGEVLRDLEQRGASGCAAAGGAGGVAGAIADDDARHGGLLDGLRVIEFAEGVAGPLAGLRMAQLGAAVVKVERPEGDWLRHATPLLDELGMSAAFFELNAGKRSLQLADAPRQAVASLRRLLGDADVFITDRPLQALRDIGLDYGADGAYGPNARLITVTLSAWGEAGPWRKRQGSELAAQAVAGYTRYLGTRDQPACRIGADVAGAGTGIFAGQAILAALYARARNGGRGQHVSLSLLNTLLALKSVHLAAQSNPDQYAGARVGGAHYPPERGWRTGKGNLFFAFGGSVGKGRPGWVNFVEEAGFHRLLDDPRFDKNGRNSAGYGIDAPRLKPEYEREFSRYTADELVEMIRKHSGNAATYQRIDEALAHPQTRALNVVREVRGAGGPAGTAGTDAAAARVRAYPARFSALQPRVHGAAPRLGQHTQEIAREAGLGPNDD